MSLICSVRGKIVNKYSTYTFSSLIFLFTVNTALVPASRFTRLGCQIYKIVFRQCYNLETWYFLTINYFYLFNLYQNLSYWFHLFQNRRQFLLGDFRRIWIGLQGSVKLRIVSWRIAHNTYYICHKFYFPGSNEFMKRIYL